MTTKKFLAKYILCKKLHGRALKVNKSDYKDCLINLSHVPYRRVALDHIGPMSVLNVAEQQIKGYVLIITCFFTKAVHLIAFTRFHAECFLEGIAISHFHVRYTGIYIE